MFLLVDTAKGQVGSVSGFSLVNKLYCEKDIANTENNRCSVWCR